MSKKKAFTGSTMTLRDFHGGSIPSDLPLPSAPGVTVRPVDRPGFDRQSSWGATMGRPDYRSRPHSSPSIRTFDEKSPFLAPTMHLGRNFDEDERKPLNAVSAPRRMISDDSFQPMEVRVGDSGRLSAQTGLGNVNGSVVTSYSSRVAEKTNVGPGLSPPKIGSNSGSYPNAWAARKEAVGITELSQPAWSESTAVSKLAHASALEKVTSGRWQTKISVHQQTDIESVQCPELENGPHFRETTSFSYNDRINVEEKESHDVMLARTVDRGLHIRDRVQYRDQQVPVSEKTGSSFPTEIKETKPTPYRDGGQLSQTDLKFPGAELQRPLSSEASERPKLKLLPRSKPLESYEQSAINHKQGYPKQIDSIHHESQVEAYETVVPIKAGPGGSESGNRTVDRPKLNLKPRSHPVQFSEAIVEKERNTLFGGALPREMVLKERGINDVADSSDLIQSPSRTKTDVRNEVASKNIHYRHGEKSENMSFDHRSSKNIDRRDLRVDVERADAQRRTWRNDNKRNNRETEKQQQERPLSPETWRKPNTDSPDATGMRYGKAASAVELAQAFSRSMSESKTAEHSPIQRSVNSRTQIPFSRLTASSPRPQINGY